MPRLVTIVLVVDHDPTARTHTAQVLKACGCSVLALSGAAEAVDTFAEHHDDIALVIADARLPRPHGRPPFLQEIREIEPDVPIILTAGSVDPQIGRYAEMGVVGVLRKPFRPDELTALVQHALEQVPGFSPSRVTTDRSSADRSGRDGTRSGLGFAAGAGALGAARLRGRAFDPPRTGSGDTLWWMQPSPASASSHAPGAAGSPSRSLFDDDDVGADAVPAFDFEWPPRPEEMDAIEGREPRRANTVADADVDAGARRAAMADAPDVAEAATADASSTSDLLEPIRVDARTLPDLAVGPRRWRRRRTSDAPRVSGRWLHRWLGVTAAGVTAAGVCAVVLATWGEPRRSSSARVDAAGSGTGARDARPDASGPASVTREPTMPGTQADTRERAAARAAEVNSIMRGRVQAVSASEVVVGPVMLVRTDHVPPRPINRMLTPADYVTTSDAPAPSQDPSRPHESSPRQDPAPRHDAPPTVTQEPARQPAAPRVTAPQAAAPQVAAPQAAPQPLAKPQAPRAIADPAPALKVARASAETPVERAAAQAAPARRPAAPVHSAVVSSAPVASSVAANRSRQPARGGAVRSGAGRFGRGLVARGDTGTRANASGRVAQRGRAVLANRSAKAVLSPRPQALVVRTDPD